MTGTQRTYYPLILVFLAIGLSNCNLKGPEDLNVVGTTTDVEEYILSVGVNGEGSVSSDPAGINCPGDCDEHYSDGTSVSLSVSYDMSTTNFDGWNGDCENAGTQVQASLLMNQDRMCEATFSTIPTEIVLPIGLFTLPLTFPENGSYFNGSYSNNYYSYKNRSKQTDPVNFGPFTGHFITGFAGEEGYVVLDLLDGEVLHEEKNLGGTGPFFGIAGATQDPPGADSPAMIVLAGSNGFVLDRFEQSGPLEFSTTTFDVFPAGGDPMTDVVTHVLPGAGIGFFVFDDSQDLYVPAEVGFQSSQFDDNQLISAYMHNDMLSDDPVPQPRGNFLVLTRETESGVYLAKWDGSDPVRAIDNIGFDARRIRCIEDDSGNGNMVCVASIFGHDRLGLMTWDGENLPVLTDFAEIGDGPVGIDLRLLQNGNIAIVSTGFNDHTVTETVVTPNGLVQSTNTQPVMEGCQSPGHAIYIPDAEGWKILGTCYDSDSYFIVESEL